MRNELDKVSQQPVTVTLGSKEYQVKPLPIKHSIPWCRAVVDLLKNLPEYAQVTVDTGEQYKIAVQEVMINSPSKIVDLFFQYAHELQRELIEGEASSAEIMAAFEAVLGLELPFLGAMAKAMTKISQ